MGLNKNNIDNSILTEEEMVKLLMEKIESGEVTKGDQLMQAAVEVSGGDFTTAGKVSAMVGSVLVRKYGEDSLKI